MSEDTTPPTQHEALSMWCHMHGADAAEQITRFREALLALLPVMDAFAAEGITMGRDDGQPDHDPQAAMCAAATALGFDGDPEAMMKSFG